MWWWHLCSYRDAFFGSVDGWRGILLFRYLPNFLVGGGFGWVPILQRSTSCSFGCGLGTDIANRIGEARRPHTRTPTHTYAHTRTPTHNARDKSAHVCLSELSRSRWTGNRGLGERFRNGHCFLHRGRASHLPFPFMSFASS